MTTLADLTNKAREHARAAQTAAESAAGAARTEVAPIREALSETQHEVEQQGTALDETHSFAEAALSDVAAIGAVVDTLILDLLTGGSTDV